MARFVVEMVFETKHQRLAEVRPAHRRYWEGLAARGVLLEGGLYADSSGGLMLCEAADDAALRRLVAGDPYVRGQLVRSVRVRADSGPRVVVGPTLTPHEQRIASLIVGGKTNREIATQFHVSVRAVELHITSIYRKLGINRRAQLAGALAA